MGLTPADEHARTVANNVRRLRESQGMSLSALSRRSSIAKATLSAIERGDGNPTISTLQSLAVALQVGVAELVAPRELGVARVVRGAGGDPGTDDVPIESFVPEGIVELYDIRYEASDHFEFPAHQPGVIERVLLQTGTLRIGSYDDLTVLESGDYVAFPADRPHRYEVVGDELVRGTLVVTYPVASPSGSPVHDETRE
ncbi:MAG: helix-turn-helix domain-containing protein [Actinobacteria bacterium]|nr:helix-turn-helix domain-containing protein [Actinomycetota bacterium]